MNENQKVVLNYLKSDLVMNENQKKILNYLKSGLGSKITSASPISPIAHLYYYKYSNKAPDKSVSKAHLSLDNKELFEVLAEYAKWGLKHEN